MKILAEKNRTWLWLHLTLEAIQGFFWYIRTCHLLNNFTTLPHYKWWWIDGTLSSCLTPGRCKWWLRHFGKVKQHSYNDTSGLGLCRAGRVSTWFLYGGFTYFHFTPRLGDGPINKNMSPCHYSANSHQMPLKWSVVGNHWVFGGT